MLTCISFIAFTYGTIKFRIALQHLRVNSFFLSIVFNTSCPIIYITQINVVTQTSVSSLEVKKRQKCNKSKILNKIVNK